MGYSADACQAKLKQLLYILSLVSLLKPPQFDTYYSCYMPHDVPIICDFYPEAASTSSCFYMQAPSVY